MNVAIGATDGNIPLYRIRPGETRGPNWRHMIASFHKGVLMKHADRIPDLESMIEVENTRCVTFETVFEKTGAEHVDLLQIDAEGFDAEVLRILTFPPAGRPSSDLSTST